MAVLATIVLSAAQSALAASPRCELYFPLEPDDHLLDEFIDGPHRYLLIGTSERSFSRRLRLFQVERGTRVSGPLALPNRGGETASEWFRFGNHVALSTGRALYLSDHLPKFTRYPIESPQGMPDLPRVTGFPQYLDEEDTLFARRSPLIPVSDTASLLLSKQGLYAIDLKTSATAKLLTSDHLAAIIGPGDTNPSPAGADIAISTKSKALLVSPDTWKVTASYEVGELYERSTSGPISLWRTATGLYKYDPAGPTLKKLANTNSRIGRIQETSQYFWITDGDHLLRWRKQSSDPAIDVGIPGGVVNEPDPTNDPVWVSSDSLYVFPKHGGASPQRVNPKIKGAPFIITGTSGTWLASREGIYLWHKDNPAQLTLWKSGLKWESDAIDFGQASAIFGVSGGIVLLKQGFDPLFLPFAMERIRATQFTHDGIWFLLDGKVVFWDDRKPATLNTTDIAAADGAELLVSQEHDRYSLTLDTRRFEVDPLSAKVTPLPKALPPANAQSPPDFGVDDWIENSSTAAIYREGTRRALGAWNLKLDLVGRLPRDILRNQELVVTWAIKDYECRADALRINEEVSLSDARSGAVLQTVGPREVVYVNAAKDTKLDQDYFRAVVSGIAERGDYNLTIQATDVFGFSWKETRRVSVGRTTEDLLMSWGRYTAAILLAANLLAFTLLVLGARKWSLCFDILVDPLFRRIGIYFGPAIRYFRPIRHWIFERYYQSARRRLSRDHDYLPVRLSAGEGRVISSNELHVELKTRKAIWIMGSAGSGKTELLLELMRSYFSRASLRQAWRDFGFIPIFVPVREFASLAASPGTWVSESARLSLRAYALEFEDPAFFRALLGCGDFVLLLDGLNEANKEADLRQWLTENRKVRLLATSQAPFTMQAVESFTLPTLTATEAAEMLATFLRPASMPTVAPDTRALLSQVTSAYDVWLIANLIEHGSAVPRTRSDLYAQSVNLAKAAGGDTFAEEPICRLAFNLWKSGTRTFLPDAMVTNAMLSALREARIVVVRGPAFEFRHDLMRGYLAARWIVAHASSVDQQQVRLEAAEIWDLGPEEQDTVFPFVAEFALARNQLDPLLELALLKPAQRARLIEALQHAAISAGYTLRVAVEAG